MLGLLALVALQVPVVVGMVVVGFFALFHGHAHGGELGEATSQSFMIGFALATALQELPDATPRTGRPSARAACCAS